MPAFPPFREIRRHLPLVAGGFLLTQIPALSLLLVQGTPGRKGIAVYAVASLVAFIGLMTVAYSRLLRLQRIVGMVHDYAEAGRLPRPDERSPDSIRQITTSLASLDGAVRRLEADAARDPLTGILNRRTCAVRLEGDLARSRRGGVPFSVALFDLDDLKAINDQHGHAAGDAALRHLAQVLQSVVREGDWAARWGGDEFLLGLWNADAAAAALVAGRVLDGLAGEGGGLGASVGIAQAQPEEDATRLFSRADASLLEAKRNGRGRVSLS